MSISSINYGSSVLGQSVRNINNQLSDLSTELSSGVKSSTYAGMGVNEGFAIAARSQLSNIAAFTTTMTNVNTIIGSANTALQSLQSIQNNVQSAASTTPQNLTSSGQSIGQQGAASNLSALVGILNTQVGDRYIFSGSAINQPAVASADDILNGTATQAGLKQVISERQQADLGTDGMGRLALSAPTATSLKLSEDVAGSPFGLKLNSVTSSLTNASVSGPSGSPPSVSVDLSGGNPSPGGQINFQFNLPDGTTDSIQLTASNTTPAALTGSAVDNRQTTLAPVTGATALSGTAGTDSIGSGFSAGDTITVNGQTLTFVAAGASGNNQINVTDNVQTLLGKIDALSGTSTPSTINSGVISLNTNAGAGLSISSSNTAAFAALGFSGRQATFAIGTTPADTTKNLQSSLNMAIGTLANTSLVAASAVEAGNNFFDTDSTATGSVVNNQQATPAPITGATLLSGAAGTDSIGVTSGANVFSAGDTITVNGQTLTFVNSGASGSNQINVTDNVQTLLSKIDALSGTSTPSTVTGGVISLHTDDGAGFSVSSSKPAALVALGFSSGTATATTPPLRVSGSPLGSATGYANGSADTVAWYTGNSGPGSARSTASVQIDTSQSVQFGAQANEAAIRNIVQQTAVYAAVSTSPTGVNSGAQIGALSQRIAANLTPQTGQQTISDIQTDFANAQTTMQDAGARQSQAQAALQSMIDQTEGISQDQVASEILQLQTNLQASYQTTSMLSQLSLVKYLSPG